MTKAYLLLTSLILLVSCGDEAKNETDTVDFLITQFDVTLSSGEIFVGVIDQDTKEIVLNDLVNPLEIKTLTCVYSENVSFITPDPKSTTSEWQATQVFRLHSASAYMDYTVNLPDYEEILPVYESLATISPVDTFGCVTNYHFLDLNANPSKLSSTSTAQTAFGEMGMNGIRFPLYCGEKDDGSYKEYLGGHPSPGVVVESVYEKPLESLKNAKAAFRGPEDEFIIFLGIKCMTSDKNEYYPNWVSSEDDYIIPAMYAQMIIDFIAFMDERGHEIYALAIDKEDVRMGTDDFKESVDSIRAMTARLGYLVPKIVAPELMDPQGDKPSGYMNTIYIKKGYESRFDIFGNHYYQRDHSATGFASLEYEYNLAQSDKPRPFWGTEPHWDGDNLLWVAETGIGCMFDLTDLGLDGFMWWNYPITGSGSFRSTIMRAYSEAILGSRPIRMVDHDGEETLTRWKLQSRAYIRGNEVNVFFINVINPAADYDQVSYEDYVIGILDDYKVDGKITFRQWRETTDNDTDYEGETTTITPYGDSQIFIDIPAGSFTQLTFTIEN